MREGKTITLRNHVHPHLGFLGWDEMMYYEKSFDDLVAMAGEERAKRQSPVNLVHTWYGWL
jgi:hypothetical protein